MTLPTKYGRQLARAQALIKRKGVLVQWVKADNTDTSDDPSPEFPHADAPTLFPVYIVFYPANRQNLYTAIAEAISGSVSSQLFGAMAGGVKFDPEVGDELRLPDGTVTHVDTINVTKPDLVPILYELSFK